MYEILLLLTTFETDQDNLRILHHEDRLLFIAFNFNKRMIITRLFYSISLTIGMRFGLTISF
jgi:hypothetical protein